MKKILTIATFFITAQFLGQSTKQTVEEHLQNRKGKLFLRSEIEYRITPYYELKTDSGLQTFKGQLAKDLQNSGTGLNYSLNFFVLKNLSLNFGQSFRYETILFSTDYPEINSSSKSQKSFLLDYHFSIDYFIPLSKSTDIYLRVGYSMLNTGSEFTVTQKSQAGNFWVSQQYDTEFSANNFAIGFKRKRIDLCLGTYQTEETPYEDVRVPTLFPYIKISYDLLKL